MIDSKDTASRPSPSPIPRPVVAACLATAILFVIITLAVHSRRLAPLDLAVAQGISGLDSATMRSFSALASILFSGEVSLLFGFATAAWLWRRGLARWSLAPLAFLALVALEIILKLTVDQPALPGHFHREVYYPLASVSLHGAFPSGHAIRTAFFCFFAIALVIRHGTLGRFASAALGALVLLIGFSRLYLGYHWLSDVVAGLLLGSALALLVAIPVASKIAQAR